MTVTQKWRLQCTHLPELGTNLVTALACLKMNNFSHGECLFDALLVQVVTQERSLLFVCVMTARFVAPLLTQ